MDSGAFGKAVTLPNGSAAGVTIPLGGGEGGAVAPVLQLVVVDVGHVPDVLVVLVVRGVVGVIDGDEV